MAYNTTPDYQDPNNPPSPGDPYWAAWIAANPTYRGQGYTGPAATTNTQPAPGSPAPAAPASYNYAQAVSKLEAAIGRPLKPGEGDALLKRFGGTQGSMFTDAGLAPVITYLKGPGGTAGGPGGTGTGTGTGGLPLPTFGGTPPPYVSAPWNGGTPLPRDLQSPYIAPTWQGGDFKDPTMDEVKATPGYQARMDAGRQGVERSAAFGTGLSGGTLKALDRYGQDYGTNEFQVARGNAYQNYLTKYGQFQDASAMGLGARNQNLGEWGTQRNNQYTEYLNDNSRQQGDFILNTTNKRNAENDYWTRLLALYQGGAGAAGGSYKSG